MVEGENSERWLKEKTQQQDSLLKMLIQCCGQAKLREKQSVLMRTVLISFDLQNIILC